MRGNSHVRFLGGGGVAMRCCYPTMIISKVESEGLAMSPSCPVYLSGSCDVLMRKNAENSMQ